MKKRNNQRGATLLMALLLLLVAAVVSAVILTAATSAARQAANARRAQQEYLTLSSAAELLREELAKAGTYTLERKYKEETQIGSDEIHEFSGMLAPWLNAAVKKEEATVMQLSAGLTLQVEGMADVKVELAIACVDEEALELTATLTCGEQKMVLTAAGKRNEKDPESTTSPNGETIQTKTIAIEWKRATVTKDGEKEAA